MDKNRGGEVQPLVSFDDAGIHDVVFVSRYDTISDENLHNHRVWIWEDCTEKAVISIQKEINYNYDYLFYMKALSRGKTDSDVDTLFTGSSYGVKGIDEKLICNAVNLSVSAQDLYYSVKGVCEVCKENPNIRNVVICCSYYYFFSDMSVHENDHLNRIVATLHERIYNDIHNKTILYPPASFLAKSDVFDMDRIYNIILSDNLKQNYYNETHTRFDERKVGYAGWKNLSLEEREEESIKLTERINKKIKWRYTYNENIDILNKLSAFCSDRNINLMFVVTPMTKMFRKHINPEYKPYFYEALEKAPGEIHVLDLYDSQEYSDSDFFDVSHLDVSGAEKMTRTILATLDEINATSAGENKRT